MSRLGDMEFFAKKFLPYIPESRQLDFLDMLCDVYGPGMDDAEDKNEFIQKMLRDLSRNGCSIILC